MAEVLAALGIERVLHEIFRRLSTEKTTAESLASEITFGRD
jgi:hypothetical protein